MFEKKSKLVILFLNQKMLTCGRLELETIGAPPSRAGRWAWRIEAGFGRSSGQVRSQGKGDGFKIKYN